MDFFDTLISALRTITSNRLRSFLTMLGIVIGIMAVIILVSMGESAKVYVANQLRGWGLGAHILVVRPGKSGIPGEAGKLTYKDSSGILKNCPSVKAVIPVIVGSGKVKFGKSDYFALVGGVTETYPAVVNQKVVRGHFFSADDRVLRRKVIMLGMAIYKSLFGQSDPVGERVKLRGENFIVRGVLEEKGQVFTLNFDERVLIPITVAEGIYKTNRLSQLLVAARSEDVVEKAENEVDAYLFAQHKKVDYNIRTQEGMLMIMGNILTALTGIVGAIASISLVVGGIGVMNIMLVSVVERTREIGIRKAVGARRRDIFFQFLVEAAGLTLFGGIIGVILGIIAAFLILRAFNFTTVIATWSVGLALLVSVGVGIFFGVYPAGRAAALPPVEALRYE